MPARPLRHRATRATQSRSTAVVYKGALDEAPETALRSATSFPSAAFDAIETRRKTLLQAVQPHFDASCRRPSMLAQLLAFGIAAVPVPHPVALGFGSAVLFAAVLAAMTWLTRAKPAAAVFAIVVCDPYDFAHTLGPTSVTLPKVVLIGAIAGLVLRRASLATLLDRRARRLVMGAAGIFAATALSAIPAEYIDAVARETLKALQNLATLATAAVAFAAEPEDEYVWAGVSVASVSVCVLALLQEFTIAPSGVLIHGAIYPRIAGPLEGPNQLAGYFDLAIPMLVAGLTRGRYHRVTLAILVLALLTDLLTLSRGSLLGLIPGVALALALTQRWNLRELAVAAAAGLTGIVATGALLLRSGALTRYASFTEVDQDNGLATRAVLWSAAVKMWLSDPGLGVGAGNFELQTPSVGLVGVRTHANSLYLQSLAEGGVLLFAAVVWTIVSALTTMLAARSRGPLVVGIAAATLALGTHELVDYLSFFPKVGGYWWALLGIGIGALGTAAPPPGTHRAARGND